MKEKINGMSAAHLASLARLSSYEEWPVLQLLMSNRVNKDKNSIVTYPESEPIKLATMKAFYRGRISAMNIINREVGGAAVELEKFETKSEDKPNKK